MAGWFGVLRALAGVGSDDHVAYVLQTNCIRLSQAAIQEYQLGAQSVEHFHEALWGLTGIHLVIVAANHFESCLWNLERFIKHAKALRSLESAEMDLKKLIPRSLLIVQQHAESRITRLRHKIAHLESAAQNFELPEGENIVLRPVKNGLVLGNEVITWAELEKWLRETHRVAEQLAEFRSNA